MVGDDTDHDPTSFQEPSRSDAAQYKDLRGQPGKVNQYHSVTATSDHIGSGHDQHARPGHVSTSDGIKLLICLLLMRHDLRHVRGQVKPRYMSFETT